MRKLTIKVESHSRMQHVWERDGGIEELLLVSSLWMQCSRRVNRHRAMQKSAHTTMATNSPQILTTQNTIKWTSLGRDFFTICRHESDADGIFGSGVFSCERKKSREMKKQTPKVTPKKARKVFRREKGKWKRRIETVHQI